MTMTRFITLWRKTGDQCLDWDQHVSNGRDEAERVVENIKLQGVRQWSTYQLGALEPTLSDSTHKS